MQSLLQILVDHLKAVTVTELRIAENESRRTGEKVEDALCRLGFVKEDTIAQAFGIQYQLPVIAAISPSEVDLGWIREHSSFDRVANSLFLPLRPNGKRFFAIAPLTDLSVFDLISSTEGHTRDVVVTTKKVIHEAIEVLSSPPTTAKLEELVVKGLEEGTEGNAIEELVDSFLREAIRRKATDLHIEPTNETTQIYLRIDGIRHPLISLPPSLHEGIINVIKVRANIKPDQHFTPDDKKFTFSYLGRRTVDIRVSLLPSAWGAAVVNRILDKMSSLITLEDLGYSQRQLELIAALARSPNGLILVTGPTGSGKTTTLYALLTKTATPEKKLITIEDPIEYTIPRVIQCQAREDREFDFAKALRSIIRHDPDIIMVGEIRDKETARVAMEASLTGHLVFSTLHTNSAVDSIVRLMDMGVPPIYIGSTLRAVIAQRLIRKLCNSCKKKVALDEALAEKWRAKSREAWESRGCEECGGTGYKGRTVVAEVLVVEDELAQLIYQQQPAATLRRSAMDKGFVSIESDGIEKVLGGITDLKELSNVMGTIH